VRAGVRGIADVSPQYFGVENYSGIHDPPNRLEEDFSRIMVAKDGIFPIRDAFVPCGV
jgi:hypothetical protein